jgi:signal transduction histidine kinase
MEQLIGVYIGIQTVYAIFTSIIWIFNRNQKAYLYLSLLWFGSLINFGTQLASGDNQFLIAISLITNAIPTLSLVKLYAYSTSTLDIPYKHFLKVIFIGLVFSILAFYFGEHFILMSLPIAFSVIYPLLYLSFKVIIPKWKQIDSFEKIFTVIILINSLHYIDFPFLRLNTSFAPIGFGIAFSFMLIFAIFLPAFISKLLEMQNTKFFESEVQKRTVELEQAKEEKSQLLNILSHDLSTPIQILDFNLQRLGDKNLSSDKRIKFVDKSLIFLRQINLMLDQVKFMSALDMGKADIGLVPMLPDKILQSCRELFCDRLKEKGILFFSQNHITSGNTFMGNDVILISNIISNFLSNSIKFTSPGGEIRVSLYEDYDREEITIEISDSGIGIHKEKVDDIFSSKKRSEVGTNGETGTGLGLSVAIYYIKRLNARIEINSRPSDLHPQDHGTDIEIIFKKVNAEEFTQLVS